MLQVHHLSYEYDPFFGPVFQGVDISVSPGDKVALLGANGCGKSTLLRLLAGEIEPQTGTLIRSAGETVSILHQDFDFAFDGTVSEFFELSGIAEKANYQSVDDLLAAIGFGELSAEAVVKRISGHVQLPAAPLPSAPPRQGALRLNVSAPGAEGILFRLSRCCCPVPGDDIVGYVSRGRGVAVHRADCQNLAEYRRQEPERLMTVEWTLSQEAYYPVQIEIEALDRIGLLNDLTNIISTANTNIRSARITTKKPRLALFHFTVDISDTTHLDRLLKDIAARPDVLRVYRLRST